MTDIVPFCLRTFTGGRFLAGSEFNMQEHLGGYMYSSAPDVTAPSIENSLDDCKAKCRDCWSVTYYAGLKTDYAKRCYVYMSEAECGTLIGWTETLDIPMWSEVIGRYNSTLHQYTADDRVVVWPGSTTKVPVDYSSGASGTYAWVHMIRIDAVKSDRSVARVCVCFCR